jgi:iron(III) transport system substrate-binding protein
MGYNSAVAKDIPLHFRDKEHHWIGFSARARVLIFNKNLLKVEDIPKSIFDLLDVKYRGKFAIANPLFGTTSFHFASWFSAFGEDKARELLAGLKKNDVLIATSNGDVKKRVLNGEIAFGLTDTDDAFVAMRESKDMGIVFLDQEGIGSLVMPNSISLMKNSPHSTNGKRLIDYLLSKETEKKLALSCGQMPLHGGVETPKDILSLDNIVSMKIDYNKTSKKLEEIQGFLKVWGE